jgi:hypothetical protein
LLNASAIANELQDNLSFNFIIVILSVGPLLLVMVLTILQVGALAPKQRSETLKEKPAHVAMYYTNKLSS